MYLSPSGAKRPRARNRSYTGSGPRLNVSTTMYCTVVIGRERDRSGDDLVASVRGTRHEADDHHGCEQLRMAAHCLAEGTGRKRNLEVATAGTDCERRVRWQHGGKVEHRRQIAQLRRSDTLAYVGVPSRPALLLPGGAHLHEDDGHRRGARAACATADVQVGDQASCASLS